MKNKSVCVSPETKYPTVASGPALNLISLLAILYSVFMVYGSLVPLHYVPRPFNEALTAFRNISFLTLGIDSRADWAAKSGTEPVIMKHGKIFSAWQFILSPNRENYVSGLRLYLHFVVAFGVSLSCYSLIQASPWGPMLTDQGGKNRSRDRPNRMGAS